MGRVRTFFPKILQGVRFLVDGYVYTGPYSNNSDLGILATIHYENVWTFIFSLGLYNLNATNLKDYSV